MTAVLHSTAKLITFHSVSRMFCIFNQLASLKIYKQSEKSWVRVHLGDIKKVFTLTQPLIKWVSRV